MKPVSPRPAVPPRLALFFAILAVSTASIFIRFAQGEAGSLAISAYRLVLAALILLPFSVSSLKAELPVMRRGEIVLGFLSGLLLALHFATWITSLEYTTVASSVVLVTTTPLWVAIFSPLLLHERLDASVWIGLGLALVGGAVVGISDACRVGTVGITCPAAGSLLQGRAMGGNLLALVGAWCAAGYLMIGRKLRARLSLQTYTTFVYGVAGLILVLLVAAARQPVTGFSPLIYLWLLCLAVIPQVLGHSTYNWSLRYLPATMVSVSLLGEPIGSTILAYLLLGETPTAVKLFGGLLILAGIYLAARRAAAPESDALLVDAS